MSKDSKSISSSGSQLVAPMPAWKKVLQKVAQVLDQHDVPYIVSGGTSVNLQGVKIPVRDLDIETTKEGAYRFQELFPSQVVTPVTFCQSEDGLHQSHFGVFNFSGVKLEVMGDHQRRQGNSWTPTWSSTRKEILLDSVPIMVSWIEEETLAYIRRGRLERAAACLVLCDQTRLLALLRGEVYSHVL